MFTFKYKDQTITVDNASDSIDDWIVKEAEVIKYSKESVITESFIKQFPHIAVLGDTYEEKFDYVTNLVSRSDKLLQWFAIEKIKYSNLSQLPNYLDGLVEPSEFKHIQENITSINKSISDFSDRRKKATEKYKQELRLIDKEERTVVDNKINSNKIIKVLTLTSQSLPLSMVSAIESYNAQTTDTNFDEKKKLYGRELLTKFKVSLLKAIKDNPDIDLDSLIDELSLK